MIVVIIQNYGKVLKIPKETFVARVHSPITREENIKRRVHSPISVEEIFLTEFILLSHAKTPPLYGHWNLQLD